MSRDPDERRRNCADAIRAELMKRQNRRKKVDPALSVAVQMLALLSSLISLFPTPSTRPVLVLPAPPRRSPEPAAQAFRPYVRYHQRSPSWPRLIKDLGRPVTRTEARALLYSRLPIALHPWLAHVIANDDWSAIRPFCRSGATDADVIAGATAAQQQWLDALQQRAKEKKRELDGEAGGKAGSGAKPGADGAVDDDGRMTP